MGLGLDSLKCCCRLGQEIDDDFEKVHSCKANGAIPVAKYVSKSTGFTVVHAKIGGPIVNGYICVGTRAQDDDGLAHTLEHLIFLGSEDFPYAGILDRVANKCLSSGTNAWTDVDHTCFTLSTAGSDGFCKLLPIYLDHIFYPLLTDAAFTTEVYHVKGNGTDGGVVYSEMQAAENTSFSKATCELFKSMFPAESGYRWNAGGALRNLRESCCNEDVKAFHHKFYHPQNACLIVCGMVDRKALFRNLRLVVKKWIKTGKCEVMPCMSVQPWLSEECQTIPNVDSSQEKTVYYSSSDEEAGCLTTIGLLGPSKTSNSNEMEETCAISQLLKYLTKSSCSPLQTAFVEDQSESLATSVEFSMEEYIRPLFYFELEGVKMENKSKIVPLLREVIGRQVANFDIVRMFDIIKSGIQADLSTLENEPHGWISQVVIQDFLYTPKEDHSKLKKRLNRISMLQDFLSKPTSFWTTRLEEWILLPHWIAVFVEPNASYLNTLIAQEESRIAKRNEKLGKEGLGIYARKLEAAIAFNSQPVPAKVLKKIDVPSVKSVEYHKVRRIQNPPWILEADFPSNICMDDIQTNFVYVGVMMDTSNLDYEFRAYLPLFKEVILNSPIKLKAKELIPYEEVVAERDRDLQVCELNLGLELAQLTLGDQPRSRCSSGSFSHLLTLILQMELEKVERGMEWIHRILWSTRIQMDRVKVAMKKLVGDIHQVRQQGSRLYDPIMKSLVYMRDSNASRSSVVHQLKLLLDLGAEDDLKLAKSENDIRTAFDCILNLITDPSNLSLHIAANVPKLREKLDMSPSLNLSNLLRKTFQFELSGSNLSTFKHRRRIAARFDTEFMPRQRVQVENAASSQIIFGLGSEDSSNLVMVGPGPASFRDSQLPALFTMMQYFTQMEGPLYKSIRGGGYAYSYNLTSKISEGLIYFSLCSCSDVVGAYAAVLDLINCNKLWTEEFLVSFIFECLELEKSPLNVASNSCLFYYRDVPETYLRDLINKVGKLKLKHLKRMAKQYLFPMFREPNSNFATVIVCPLEQVESIHAGMLNSGKRMHIVKSFDELDEPQIK